MDIKTNPYRIEYQAAMAQLEKSRFLGRDLIRQKLVQQYSWAIPTPQALKAIKHYGKIVEIGAGTGYWAAYLQAYGVDVLPYDLYVPNKDKNPWLHKNIFTTVYSGAAEWVANKYSDRTLMMSWPPYDSQMAYEALTTYRGKYFIYVGELKGGCTATDSFFNHLERHWTIKEDVDIDQWPRIYDRLLIFERNPIVEPKMARKR